MKTAITAEIPTLEEAQIQTEQLQWEAAFSFRWPFSAVAPCLEPYKGFTLIQRPFNAPEHLRQEHRAQINRSRTINRALLLWLYFMGLEFPYVAVEVRNGMYKCIPWHIPEGARMQVYPCMHQGFRVMIFFIGMLIFGLGWSTGVEHEYLFAGSVVSATAIELAVAAHLRQLFDEEAAAAGPDTPLFMYGVAGFLVTLYVAIPVLACYAGAVILRRCRMAWVKHLYALMLRDRGHAQELESLL